MTKKVIVIIHGAGNQPGTYPEAEVDALEAQLGFRPAYLAVRYDDMVVAKAISRGIDDAEARRAALEEAKKRWVESLRAQAAPPKLRGTKRGGWDLAALESQITATLPTIDDCLKYLILDSEEFRKAVQAQLIAQLKKATTKYEETILVSHSLGSVISFDVLREHAASYPLATWFTMGSPLRRVVALGLRSNDLGQINTKTVRKWHNLYDTTDLVASPLAPAFPPYDLHDDFVEVSEDFPAAHHYWENEESVRIIADALR